MTRDSGVPIESTGKVHWAQLQTVSLPKGSPATVWPKLRVTWYHYLHLADFCCNPHIKLPRIWITAATGMVARWGCARCPWNGTAQVDRRSVTRRPHSCCSKIDSKQSSKRFMTVKFLFQLPEWSRWKLWAFDRFKKHKWYKNDSFSYRCFPL